MVLQGLLLYSALVVPQGLPLCSALVVLQGLLLYSALVVLQGLPLCSALVVLQGLPLYSALVATLHSWLDITNGGNFFQVKIKSGFLKVLQCS